MRSTGRPDVKSKTHVNTQTITPLQIIHKNTTSALGTESMCNGFLQKQKKAVRFVSFSSYSKKPPPKKSNPCRLSNLPHKRSPTDGRGFLRIEWKQKTNTYIAKLIPSRISQSPLGELHFFHRGINEQVPVPITDAAIARHDLARFAFQWSRQRDCVYESTTVTVAMVDRLCVFFRRRRRGHFFFCIS